MKALAMAPTQRYQTAEELREDLDAFAEYAELQSAFRLEQWSLLQKKGLDRLRELRSKFADECWQRLYWQWEARGAEVLQAACRPANVTWPNGDFASWVLPHPIAATQAIGASRRRLRGDGSTKSGRPNRL